MKRLARGLFLSLILAFAVYAALAQLGPQLLPARSSSGINVSTRLREFPLSLWALGLLLASINYAFRFARWEYYLRLLGVRIPTVPSLVIFLSGFSLTVTPGKIGEVLKSYLLKQTYQVSLARTAPIVVAERLTDLIALLLLTLLGVATWMGPGEAWLIGLGFGLCAALLGVVSSQRLAHGSINLCGRLLPGRVRERVVPRLHEFYEATALLVRPRALLLCTATAVLSWACECVAFWVVLRGFPGVTASLLLSTFIYATMTVAGALALFVPGGLGVTEAGMILLLSRLGSAEGSVAVAATLIIRLVTLWFAVLLGVVALLLVQRLKHVSVDLDRLKKEDQ